MPSVTRQRYLNEVHRARAIKEQPCVQTFKRTTATHCDPLGVVAMMSSSSVPHRRQADNQPSAQTDHFLQRRTAALLKQFSLCRPSVVLVLPSSSGFEELGLPTLLCSVSFSVYQKHRISENCSVNFRIPQCHWLCLIRRCFAVLRKPSFPIWRINHPSVDASTIKNRSE